MAAHDEFALDLLKEAGYVTAEDIAQATSQSTSNGDGPLEHLIKSGRITAIEVSRALANAAAAEFQEDIGQLPDNIVQLVPREIAQRYKIVPIGEEDGVLRIAVRDPFDLETIDSLNFVIKKTFVPVVVPPDVIDEALSKYYGSLADAVAALTGGASEGDLQIKSGTQEEDTTVSASDAPIIQLCYKLITDAHRMGASDIHIEPLEKRLRVRYRIDGVLQEMQDQPKRIQSAIIARFKVMSAISIAEKRLPQDGRIQLNIGNNKIDLRVSTVPTNHGESIVMRILDKSALLLGLPELGFFSDDQATMERILGFADGIFLVTGPTGSGKTTTLYACLNYINKPDKKIITVEDPVEYVLKGVNQVPVNHDVGMTFAAALRAMLRQAPNIIMVGEIRDVETANIAINASLTGHLVFSTLHTNDAPGAITRLVDMGVKPFLVASSLKAVMAQRLIRRVCQKCAQPYEPSEAEIATLGFTPAQLAEARFMKGKGCEKCRGTGYKGRAGIFEIFTVDDEMRQLINNHASLTEIRQRARQMGMRTLREDGIRKALAGFTTIEEVVSATMGDKA